MYLNNKDETLKTFISPVINLFKDLKKEIEAEGGIATAEEIINRLEVIQESYRITENHD